jgi:hypothetical protein
MNRTTITTLLALVVLVLGNGTATAEETTPPPTPAGCPAELVALAPKAAEPKTIGGTWTDAGPMAMGVFGCELLATHDCEVTKSPGKLALAIRVIKDPELNSPMQVDGLKQQYAEELGQLKTKAAKLKPGAGKLIRASKVIEETIPGGQIAYYDLVGDCSEDTHKERPSAWLTGIVWSSNAYGSFTIEGAITGEEAKTAAIELMKKFIATDFAKIPQP